MNNLSSNKLLQSLVKIKNHYISTSVSERGIMTNDFRENKAKDVAKKVFDITRALLIIAIGVVMILGDRYNVPLAVGLDPILKYGFGGTCLLYGGFRLYRGIKGENYL